MDRCAFCIKSIGFEPIEILTESCRPDNRSHAFFGQIDRSNWIAQTIRVCEILACFGFLRKINAGARYIRVGHVQQLGLFWLGYQQGEHEQRTCDKAGPGSKLLPGLEACLSSCEDGDQLHCGKLNQLLLRRPLPAGASVDDARELYTNACDEG